MNTVHFETTLCNFLDRYLVDRDCIDMHKPECPDVADKMVGILNSFIHDAVKEYNSYPLATLSWMMYTELYSFTASWIKEFRMPTILSATCLLYTSPSPRD